MPSPHSPAQPPLYPSLSAAVLSYLVPGLGQLSQGRVGKGLLFLVCLYGLFFYGMALGSWRNVFLPDTLRKEARETSQGNWPRVAVNLYNRPQFAGQFWIGAAAWPALWQYLTFDAAKDDNPPLYGFQRSPDESVLNDLQINGDKTWDLGWVYTVIAGVLNILVIYDAFAGPAFAADGEATPGTQEASLA